MCCGSCSKKQIELRWEYLRCFYVTCTWLGLQLWKTACFPCSPWTCLDEMCAITFKNIKFFPKRNTLKLMAVNQRRRLPGRVNVRLCSDPLVTHWNTSALSIESVRESANAKQMEDLHKNKCLTVQQHGTRSLCNLSKVWSYLTLVTFPLRDSAPVCLGERTEC